MYEVKVYDITDMIKALATAIGVDRLARELGHCFGDMFFREMCLSSLPNLSANDPSFQLWFHHSYCRGGDVELSRVILNNLYNLPREVRPQALKIAGAMFRESGHSRELETPPFTLLSLLEELYADKQG